MPIADKLLWQIESSLHQPLSLATLSKRCAASVYHMSRAFQLTTGMSPMTYVRARRLSQAADELALQDKPILAVALDAQYGSHEAFTRAFASYFGVLPSSVRSARSTSSLSLLEPLKMKKEMIVDVPKHEFKERGAFRVVGLSADCTFEYTSAIPPLWQSFNTRENGVSGAVPGSAYGVCCNPDETGRFRYVAGVEATQSADGMDFVDIPASRYSVFIHSGHISDLPKTVYTIWNKCLPDAGIEPAKSPDFELYDSRFNPETGNGDVEIWVPVT